MLFASYVLIAGTASRAEERWNANRKRPFGVGTSPQPRRSNSRCKVLSRDLRFVSWNHGAHSRSLLPSRNTPTWAEVRAAQRLIRREASVVHRGSGACARGGRGRRLVLLSPLAPTAGPRGTRAARGAGPAQRFAA